MKINDIINLLAQNKSVAILTPDDKELKLLRDRIILNSSNVKVIDDHLLEINGSKLLLITPGTVYLSKYYDRILVEFPDSIPSFVFSRLPAMDILMVHSEIV